MLFDFDRKLLEFYKGNEMVGLQGRPIATRTPSLNSLAIAQEHWKPLLVTLEKKGLLYDGPPIYHSEVSYDEECEEEHDQKLCEEGSFFIQVPHKEDKFNYENIH